jgi:hypothetical protein
MTVIELACIGGLSVTLNRRTRDRTSRERQYNIGVKVLITL